MATARPAPKKRAVPATYGEEQGYKDRRIPFMNPFEAIMKIWKGPTLPKPKTTTPKPRKAPDAESA